MSNILPFLAQYELLQRTAKHLSTLDILHLASTCTTLHTLILKSPAIFSHLKRTALCDGHGLRVRQNYEGVYSPGPERLANWLGRRKAHYDEEIEIRVWNLECDAANALPCLKCGVNVCEECRYLPRVRDSRGWASRRRPHWDPAYQSHTVVCYCTACDDKVERELPLSLSELCDCDQYKRWICLPCHKKEDKEDNEYYTTRTQFGDGPEDDDDLGMWLSDHQHSRAFWCPCGERPPREGNVRCAWCKRRHDRNTWMDHRRENPSHIPAFDEDPCFPKMGDGVTYPVLTYNGPIAP